jgi:hypothetical protein
MKSSLVARGKTDKQCLLHVLSDNNVLTQMIPLESGDVYEVHIFKPEKKKLDWSKIPKGTTVLYREFELGYLSVFDVESGCFSIARYLNGESMLVDHYSETNVRLAEQSTFTYWPGGECPLPEGVQLEIVMRNGESMTIGAQYCCWDRSSEVSENFDSDIIAYRIIGLAEGWEY